MWDVGIWDAWDVGCSGCGMFGMCYVRDVEELNGIEIDGILNLENLSKTVFIDQECWNMKVVVDVGEFTRNITIKKKSQTFQKPLNVHSVIYATGKNIFLTRT